MNYERIDELLKERHMSRRELARRAGISIDSMSTRFTRKSKTIPLADIMAIARVLGVDVAEIAFTEDERRVWQSEQPQWISVKDRLPEPPAQCLVYSDKAYRPRGMETATYTKLGWMTAAYFPEVTHWMPLPEPPKEGV